MAKEKKTLALSAGILLVYMAFTLIGATHHELWFDEAQAWGIARDTTLSGLPEVLKHEGHPGLWHVILMPFAKAGAFCEIINIISWLFMSAAAGLFMFKAPFNIPFKAAVLFSSGFLYYNSVNSRVYCLIPLLLFLISVVYPKRDKYAAVFGLLVGLLANTHIMMCGLVGVLGIVMLIELIQGIRQHGFSANRQRIAGLVIAGSLVVVMILPLLGSLSANNMVQDRRLGFSNILLNALSVFYDIGKNLLPEEIGILGAVVGIIAAGIVILTLVSYKRAAVMCGVFTLMYAVTVEIIWFTTPLRAPIVIYTYVAIFWIAVQNENPRQWTIPSEKTSELGKKFIGALNRVLEKPVKSISVMLFAVLLISVPSGAYLLIYDSFNDIVLTEAAAEFISEELPEDSVFITPTQAGVQFNVYNPNIRLYSLELQRFITYHPHEIPPEEIDYSKVRDDLKNEKHLFYVKYLKNDFSDELDLSDEDIVYYKSIKIPSYTYTGAVMIERVSLEDILE